MRLIPLALVALLLWAPTASSEPGEALDEIRRLTREGACKQALEQAARHLQDNKDDVAAWRLAQDLSRTLHGDDAKPLAGEAETAPLIRRGLEARRLAPKEAASALAALLTEEGVSPLFQLDLARALIDAGKPTQAESVVQRLIKERPDETEAHVLLGKALTARGKFTGARAAYEKALVQTPGLAKPTVALAELLRKAGREKAARAALDDALTLYPRNPQLVLGLVDDQLISRDAEAVVETLRNAVELRLRLRTRDLHVRLAQAFRMLKKLTETEASARKALEDDPECIEALRALGYVKQKKADYAGALAQYEKVVALRPSWPQGYVDVGFAHTLADNRREARKALERALKLDKKHLDANLKMGIYHRLGKNYKQATKHLEFVLKADDENAVAHRCLGYVLVAEGKAKKAIKHFEKTAELLPRNASAQRMVGRALLEMGKLDKAIEAFRDAIARDKTDAFSYFDLGKGLEKQEKFEDAEAAYRKAIELDPKFTHPLLYLAELLDDVNGEPEAAVEYYKRYLELGGHDEGESISKRIDQIEKK